jgi:hypothetical protein
VAGAPATPRSYDHLTIANGLRAVKSLLNWHDGGLIPPPGDRKREPLGSTAFHDSLRTRIYLPSGADCLVPFRMCAQRQYMHNRIATYHGPI